MKGTEGGVQRRIIFFLWVCLIFWGVPYAAAKEDVSVSASLVAEAPDADGVFWAAVRLVPAPEWHLYWKNPGDSGLAPAIVWRLPEGVHAEGKARWQTPRTFESEGIVNYGYAGETYFFIPLRADKPLATGTRLEADVEWLACRDLCVPGRAFLTLDAPFAEPAETFEAARRRLPASAAPGRVTARDSDGALILFFASGPSDPSAEPYFYSEEESLVKHSAPQRWSPVTGGHELEVPKEEPGVPAPASVRGIVVASGGWEGPGSPEGLEVELDLKKENP